MRPPPTFGWQHKAKLLGSKVHHQIYGRRMVAEVGCRELRGYQHANFMPPWFRDDFFISSSHTLPLLRRLPHNFAEYISRANSFVWMNGNWFFALAPHKSCGMAVYNEMKVPTVLKEIGIVYCRNLECERTLVIRNLNFTKILIEAEKDVLNLEWERLHQNKYKLNCSVKFWFWKVKTKFYRDLRFIIWLINQTATKHSCISSTESGTWCNTLVNGKFERF